MRTRKDGWPLCPRCGEDELYCLMVPACICAGMACYSCGWRGDPRTGEQNREQAIGEAIRRRLLRHSLTDGDD